MTPLKLKNNVEASFKKSADSLNKVVEHQHVKTLNLKAQSGKKMDFKDYPEAVEKNITKGIMHSNIKLKQVKKKF
jgi:hypothetical protein